jgi:putative ABC transport system permease protein
MKYGEVLEIGLEGLRAHKLRSFLTMLGIIFGVAAVIAMLSIGEGARQEALEQIQMMGINNIIIYDQPTEDVEEGTGRTNLSLGLTLADARAIRETNPLVDEVVPQRDAELRVRYGSEEAKAVVVGTTPAYASVMNYAPAKGRFFSYRDVLEVRRVCAIGSGIKRDLFYFKDPIGERIKIGSDWYTVVGVMENKAVRTGKGGALARDTNRDIYIPITNAMHRFTRAPFESEIDRIAVRVADAGRIREAANVLKKMMDRRHNGVKDFRIVIPEELLRQRQATQRIFNIVMGAIAGISLLVGGIGIMNIMLASILERTREIGVRRAVGARRRDVMAQFLLEATVLSFFGGVIGILLGFSLTKVITYYAEWRTIVSISSIVLAFGVSAAVGIVFGFFPAR